LLAVLCGRREKSNIESYESKRRRPRRPDRDQLAHGDKIDCLNRLVIHHPRQAFVERVNIVFILKEQYETGYKAKSTSLANGSSQDLAEDLRADDYAVTGGT
jgi:hypothetical protein